jgi:hypothetical protein
MDQGEILVQFMQCTGTDVDFAQSFLETNGWDLDLCVNLYLESGGHPQQQASQSMPIPMAEERFNYPSDPSPYIEPEVRAPIMPKHEVLVEEDPYEAFQRARRAQRAGFHNNAPKSVFEMFRDFNQEAKSPKRNVPETEKEKKTRTLADLFRPPLELIEPGSFEDVKQKALLRGKWLLVNIQTITEFDCQRLNRDTWSDSSLKSLVAESFVLWQVLRESEEGSRYCRFYSVDILPHIAIIDSRTGERLVKFEGFIDASGLKNELIKFSESHVFNEADAISKSETTQQVKRKGDMSEEEQLMAAIAASLGSKHEEETDVRREVQAPPAHVTHSVVQPVTPPTPVVVAEPPAAVPVVESVDPTIKDAHSNPSPENTCTLQIRLPSGAIKGHFRPTDTLSLVHKYTALHLAPGASFTLCSSFPKRSFTGDMLSQTLQQADLVPRAVLNCEMH